MKESIAGAEFRFRRNDNIGTADAELDDRFLSDCFVETGDLDALRDCSDPKRVIVGRTGSGKSALVRMLRETEEHVVEIPPQNLSLSYIANSDVINFFEAAGVNLDVFYQLLWRHVLTVELLKHKFKINNEAQKQSFLSSLFSGIRKDRSKEQAISYLREWGERFWDETEYRVKELTTKVETDLTASIGSDFAGMKLDGAAGRKLTEEQKHDVIQRGNKVVNQIQIKALADVIRVLSEDIFNDPKERYFMTIDDLDTAWVAEALRYKLIRALIEAVRSFRKISYVKVVISIRLDLLDRVIDATRDGGFQEEKYQSLYLKLRWTKGQIEDLINRRLEKLIQDRYTTRRILVSDLLPIKIGASKFMDYLSDRTFFRPRDAILFVNSCLDQADGRNKITAQMVSTAEGEYSRKRLISLQEEWGVTYPNLTRYTRILLQRPMSFRLSVISREDVEAMYYGDFSNDLDGVDVIINRATEVLLNGNGVLLDILRPLMFVFYAVGLVGIKPDATSPTFWSFHNNDGPTQGSLNGQSTIYIHPMFWRTLGTRERV
ncbi:P-loop ATPase, Sll1717 family [Burkholderia stagnalis]|uniref:P-loop ATPase, Sll1717 family n=1 Tax=Burkholderia stagnalis TaxID=1503054 RepID=UPI000A72455E|nr:DNA repair protein [Burkholderia stagnalis]